MAHQFNASQGVFLRNQHIDDFGDCLLNVGVVGHGAADCHITSAARFDAPLDQLSGIDQQSRTDAFLETMFAEVSYLVSDRCQAARHLRRHAAFMLDDVGFDINLGVIKLEADESLTGRRIEQLMLETCLKLMTAGFVRCK